MQPCCDAAEDHLRMTVLLNWCAPFVTADDSLIGLNAVADALFPKGRPRLKI